MRYAAVHDHDGTAGRQYNKPETDIGEASDSFSKHNRRISVILENISPLQLRQRPPQMVRFMSNFHTSAGGEAFVVDPLPDKSAVHDHDGTAGRQHKPVTDTGEATDSFQQTQTSDICRPEDMSPLQLRQHRPKMARVWAISICRRAVEPPSSTPCLVTLLRLSERLAKV